ncbi:MAG: hypothetical protein UY72_C0061G0001 [Candidatus Uhrbacteria bacterium GW2011_GWD2_52_7]|uniref:Uncharacterized protein n=1 Tax=Candidatus Uhrbacteria bacterium GW2011_GWD2_52_7 TaxID=1618989 RepID=A0A0G1XCW2_9BACT|nr:MAG: hypothetical protein UY72_C0061G0001 [Candidatus Uhrbacteria bacterium GW2011_GWD2_52_7]
MEVVPGAAADHQSLGLGDLEVAVGLLTDSASVRLGLDHRRERLGGHEPPEEPAVAVLLVDREAANRLLGHRRGDRGRGGPDGRGLRKGRGGENRENQAEQHVCLQKGRV